jgi:glutaredoxin
VLIARILVLLTAFIAFTSMAQIVYLGKDASGNVTLSKEPPPDFAALPKSQAPSSSRVPTNSKSAYKTPSNGPAKARTTFAQGELVLYAAGWCPYCRQSGEYFKQRGIAYTVIDIDSPEGQRAYAEADGGSGKGIPLLVDGDRKAWGFSASYYESFLKRRGVN